MELSDISQAARANYARLQPWDLTRVRQYLAGKRIVDSELVEPMEREYKRFLAITLAMPPGENFPISADVDPFWHTHLLFTHDYTSMCHEVADGIHSGGDGRRTGPPLLGLSAKHDSHLSGSLRGAGPEILAGRCPDMRRLLRSAEPERRQENQAPHYLSADQKKIVFVH